MPVDHDPSSAGLPTPRVPRVWQGAAAATTAAAAAHESPATLEPGGSSMRGTQVAIGALGAAGDEAGSAAPFAAGADAGVGVPAKVEAGAEAGAGAAGAAGIATVSAAVVESGRQGNGVGDPWSSGTVWAGDGRAGQVAEVGVSRWFAGVEARSVRGGCREGGGRWRG